MRLIRLFFFRKLAEQRNCRLQNRTANLLKDQTSYTFPSWESRRTRRKRRRTDFFSGAASRQWPDEAFNLDELHANITRFKQTTTLRVVWSGNLHERLWCTQIEYLGGAFFVHPDAWGGDPIIWLYDMFQLGGSNTNQIWFLKCVWIQVVLCFKLCRF